MTAPALTNFKFNHFVPTDPGEFTRDFDRIPVEFTGTAGKIADTINEIIELTDRTSSEIERIRVVVGKEGK